MPFFRDCAQRGQRLLEVLGDLVEVLHLVDEAQDAPVGLFLVELGVLVLGVADDVLDADLVLPQLVAEIDDLADGDRRIEDRREDHVLARLDPLGDLDLALAREERYAPHLAQVHAYRVVALRVVPVEVFLVLRSRRRLIAVAGDLLLRVLLLGDALGRDLHLGRRVDDLDVLVAQHSEHVVHLVGCDHVGRERVVHLVVGQEALGLPHLDELLNFFPITVLRRHRYLGASAPLANREVRYADLPPRALPVTRCPKSRP